MLMRLVGERSGVDVLHAGAKVAFFNARSPPDVQHHRILLRRTLRGEGMEEERECMSEGE